MVLAAVLSLAVWATPLPAAPVSTASLVEEMTDLLGGRFPGFPRPIAGEYSKGWNLHLPIPYARHCKITSDQGAFYYHVNHRTYPDGTPVTSFEASQLRAGLPHG